MLKEEQALFFNAVLGDTVPEDSWVLSDYPNERMHIYRNTVIKNLVDALSITFPGIWALIGTDCASQVARRFLKDKENFPTTGCLDDWGYSFVAYLKKVRELSDLSYLSDFAHYEWMKQLSYCRSSPRGLSLNEVHSKIRHIPDPSFVIHPSIQWFHSSYPIDEIESAIRTRLDNPVMLSKRASKAIVICVDGEVKTIWLKETQFQFYMKIHSGLALSKCISSDEVESHAELANYLAVLFNEGLIIHID